MERNAACLSPAIQLVTMTQLSSLSLSTDYAVVIPRKLPPMQSGTKKTSKVASFQVAGFCLCPNTAGGLLLLSGRSVRSSFFKDTRQREASHTPKALRISLNWLTLPILDILPSESLEITASTLSRQKPDYASPRHTLQH